MYQYQIKEVRQVVAGDTLVLVLDLGFRISTQVEVKLSNAETQQYGTKGNQARTFTEKWLADEHGPFTVQTGTDRRGDYYAQIFNSEGADLGDDLVSANLGRLVGS
jgi:endonuclease YncB( thermonuclease family)